MNEIRYITTEVKNYDTSESFFDSSFDIYTLDKNGNKTFKSADELMHYIDIQMYKDSDSEKED